jgi:protein-S-isoprenylcysteine O-methyltransferase Ste14
VSEPELHRWLVWGVALCALPTLASLLFMNAPYGRHARAGWGPTVAARTGWILMESPAVFGFLVVYALGDRARAPVPIAMLLVWQLHYVYRTLIFPFRIKSARPMPLSIALSGFAFNSVNAYINARWISQLATFSAGWLTSPMFLVGLCVFIAGWAANHHADAILLRLRAPGDTGYRVPFGGLYRWVTCPNYLGEIVEWLGWAILTASTSGLAFCLFTTANLLPRALAHHRWYRATFPDYPPERRALIPGIL